MHPREAMAPRALCGAGLMSAGSTPREGCLTSSLPPLGPQLSWAVHQNPGLTPPHPPPPPLPPHHLHTLAGCAQVADEQLQHGLTVEESTPA